jgi:hypothetical protein
MNSGIIHWVRFGKYLTRNKTDLLSARSGTFRAGIADRVQHLADLGRSSEQSGGLEIALSINLEAGLVPCGEPGALVQSLGFSANGYGQRPTLKHVALRGIKNAPAIVSTILIPSFVC